MKICTNFFCQILKKTNYLKQIDFFWNIEKEKYGKIKSVLWKKQDGQKSQTK